MRFASLAAAAAIPFVLAACAGDSVTVHNTYTSAEYNYSDVRYHNEGRASYVEVHNNPFNDEDADEAVARLMVGKTQGFDIPFTADERQAENLTKFVVVFDPPAGVNGKTSCTLDRGDDRPAQAGSVREVLVAYCLNGRDRAWVRASVDDVSGLSDPALSRLMAQATFALLPSEFSKRQGSGGGI